MSSGSDTLTVAVPKGRVLKELAPLFDAAGVDTRVLLANDRTLLRRDPQSGVNFLLLKPDDVPTYVEYGAADLGIAGRDVLMERDYDLYTLADLGIGQCRMVVAGLPHQALPTARVLRVGTKYRAAAAAYFGQRGRAADIVYVQGSVELAPLTGLSDVIVDLVQTGETLRENGLVEFETMHSISSVLVANRASLKLKRQVVQPFVRQLGQVR